MKDKQQASIDILITIHYEKIENQRENFKQFLLDEGICFHENTKDKNHSVSSYISNIDRLSKMVAKNSNAKDFDLLCFGGKNSDIDKIFEFAKRFFEGNQGFIKDCRSAIKQYKNYNAKTQVNTQKGVENE